MRDRTALVLELISKPKNSAALISELAEYGWYCDSHLAIVSKQDVLSILKQFESDQLTAEEVSHWSNSIGGRTDIGYEFGADGVVEESLYWLANPAQNWPIDSNLCQRIVALYERRKVRR